MRVISLFWYARLEKMALFWLQREKRYKVEPGNYLPLRDNIPKPLTFSVAFVRERNDAINTGKKVKNLLLIACFY